MKIVRKVRVKNILGLHTRPAATIVKILQPCKSQVQFKHRTVTVNARSIMSILMLAAQRNAQIEITIEGCDAEYTMEQLVQAFENKFGEK